MQKRTIAYSLAGVVALGVMLNACGDDATPTAAETATITAAPTRTAVELTPASAAPAAPSVPRAYNNDGTYRVGIEIQPGTYSYTVKKGNGYWALCADVACEVGEGMIGNDWIPTQGATGYLDIPTTAAFVELKDLALAPA